MCITQIEVSMPHDFSPEFASTDRKSILRTQIEEKKAEFLKKFEQREIETAEREKLKQLNEKLREQNHQPATPENVEKSLALLDEYEELTGDQQLPHVPDAQVDLITEAKGTKADGKKTQTLTSESLLDVKTGEKTRGPDAYLAEETQENTRKELLLIAARRFSKGWIRFAPELLEEKFSSLSDPGELVKMPWFADFFDALVIYLPILRSDKAKPEISPGEQRLGSIEFAYALREGTRALAKALGVFSRPEFKNTHDVARFADPAVLLFDPDSPLFLKNGYPLYPRVWESVQKPDFERRILQSVTQQKDIQVAEMELESLEDTA